MTTLPQQQHTVTTWGVNKRKEEEEERGEELGGSELPGSDLENSHDLSVRQDSDIIHVKTVGRPFKWMKITSEFFVSDESVN